MSCLDLIKVLQCHGFLVLYPERRGVKLETSNKSNKKEKGR